MHYSEILKSSAQAGISGGVAMTFQVSSLMWLRTTMNYQYKNGGTMLNTLKLLRNEGGILRLYRGYPFALMQGPIARFGDTAMNKFANEALKDKHIAIKTGAGSLGASLWRILIMPIDAFKSNLQIHGKEGVSTLVNKVKISGPRVLWHGALASVGGSFLGHYPWFFTYNFLQENVPKYDGNFSSVRSMAIGFCSGTVSDVVSNSVRVIKINRQTESNVITYRETVSRIIKSDGIVGLMTRGLKTKILINGLQSSVFVLAFDRINRYLNNVN